MKYYVVYNPHAGNGRGKEEAEKLRDIMKGDELVFSDITKIDDYKTFLRGIGNNEAVIIAGGDGTLNRFVNDIGDTELDKDIYYFAVGSGNDFLHDIGGSKYDKPIQINKYLKDLPTVNVNGREYRFINGIGYGIDGYCCEVGDRMRAESKKKINYTSIAITGLLFHYHPTNATIIVDGKEHKYKKVWLAPTMNGRFYGGGMMPSPAQDRLSEHGEISVMVMYGSGKLKTLMIFPSIFSGKHIEHKDAVEVISGSEINVKFDRPTALQIDGETIKNVTEYSAFSRKRAGKELPEFERI